MRQRAKYKVTGLFGDRGIAQRNNTVKNIARKRQGSTGGIGMEFSRLG